MPASTTFYFNNNTSLTVLVTGELTSSAYNNRSNILTGVIVGTAVTSLGNNCFQGCSGLTSFTFDNQANISSVGVNTFVGCPAMNVTYVNTTYYNQLSNASQQLYAQFPSGSTFNIITTTTTIINAPSSITKTNGNMPFLLKVTSNSDAPINYSSTDTTVVTVDVVGIVTLVSPGTANIVSSQEANSSYTAGTATTQIIVNASSASNPTIISTNEQLQYFLRTSGAMYGNITSNINLVNNLVPVPSYKILYSNESIQIIKSLKNNIIYFNSYNAGLTNDVSAWQGMCEYTNGQIIICGTTNSTPATRLGLLYFGNIRCNSNNQTSIIFSVPGSEYTSCYGPRYDFTTEEFTLVGSYQNPSDSNTYGFLFRGTLANLSNSNNYITQMQNPMYNFPTTFIHSTDGNFAVGASGNVISQNQKANSKAWIYNITQQTYTQYIFNNSTYTTIYGIVLNADGSYTITGGYSNGVTINSFTAGFVADMIYDTDTNMLSFSNETSLSLNSINNNLITHFEGISKTNDPNIYTLSGDVLDANDLTIGTAFVVQRDIQNNTFKIIKSTNVDYSYSLNVNGITSCNSVLGNNIVGIFASPSLISTVTYQCVIDWDNIK